MNSRTRVKTLVDDTRIANARFFGNDPEKVPKLALTIGVGTLMDAEELLVLCTGHNKALAVHQGVEEGVNHLWTISCLQLHPRAIMFVDPGATGDLRVKTLRYFEQLERQNVVHLRESRV